MLHVKATAYISMAYFFLLLGSRQIQIRKDEDIFPSWPSGLHGEVACRQTKGMWRNDTKTCPWLAGEETVPEVKKNGHVDTAVWKRHAG